MEAGRNMACGGFENQEEWRFNFPLEFILILNLILTEYLEEIYFSIQFKRK